MSAISYRGPTQEDNAERAPACPNGAASTPRYGVTAAKPLSRGDPDVAFQRSRVCESDSHGSRVPLFAENQSSDTNGNYRLLGEEEEALMGGKVGDGRAERTSSENSVCQHRDCLCPKKPRYDDEWPDEPTTSPLEEECGGEMSLLEETEGEMSLLEESEVEMFLLEESEESVARWAGQDGIESQPLSPCNRDCNTNYFTAAKKVVSSDCNLTVNYISRLSHDKQDTILQVNKQHDVSEAVEGPITDFTLTGSKSQFANSQKQQEKDFTSYPLNHDSSISANKVWIDDDCNLQRTVAGSAVFERKERANMSEYKLTDCDDLQLETHPNHADVQFSSLVKDNKHKTAVECKNQRSKQIESDYFTSTKDIMVEECMIPSINNFTSTEDLMVEECMISSINNFRPRSALPLTRFVECDSVNSPYTCMSHVSEGLTPTSYLAKSRIEPGMAARGNRGSTKFISSKLPNSGTHFQDPSLAGNRRNSTKTSVLRGPVEKTKDSLLHYSINHPSVMHRAQGDGVPAADCIEQREILPGDILQQSDKKADQGDTIKPGSTGDRSGGEKSQTPERHSGSLTARSSAPVFNSSQYMTDLPPQHRLNQPFQSTTTQTCIIHLRDHTNGDENVGFNERICTADHRDTATQTDISWLGDDVKGNENVRFNKIPRAINCLFLAENHTTTGTQTDVSWLGDCRNGDKDMVFKKRHRESSCSLLTDNHMVNTHSSSSNTNKKLKLSDLQPFVVSASHQLLQSVNVPSVVSSGAREDPPNQPSFYQGTRHTTYLVGPAKEGCNTGEKRKMHDRKRKPLFSLSSSYVAESEVTEHNVPADQLTNHCEIGPKESDNPLLLTSLPTGECGSSSGYPNSESSCVKRSSSPFVAIEDTGTAICAASRAQKRDVGNDQLRNTRRGRPRKVRETSPNMDETSSSSSSSMDASEDNQKPREKNTCKKMSNKIAAREVGNDGLRNTRRGRPRKVRETTPNMDETSSSSYSSTDASEDNKNPREKNTCKKMSNIIGAREVGNDGLRNTKRGRPRKVRETSPNRDETSSSSSSSMDASEDNQKPRERNTCKKMSNKIGAREAGNDQLRNTRRGRPRKVREIKPNRDETSSSSSSSMDASEDNQKPRERDTCKKRSNRKKHIGAKPRKCPRTFAAPKTNKAKRGRPRRQPDVQSEEKRKSKKKRRQLILCSRCRAILSRKGRGRRPTGKAARIPNPAAYVSSRGNKLVIRWKVCSDETNQPQHETDKKRPSKGPSGTRIKRPSKEPSETLLKRHIKKLSERTVRWIVPKGSEKKKRNAEIDTKHQIVPKSKFQNGKNIQDFSIKQRVRSIKKTHKALFTTGTIPIAHVTEEIARSSSLIKMPKGLNCSLQTNANKTNMSLEIDPGVNLEVSLEEETQTLSFSSQESNDNAGAPSMHGSTGWCISREDGYHVPSHSGHEVNMLLEDKHPTCVHDCSNNTVIQSRSSVGRSESSSKRSVRIRSPVSQNGETVQAAIPVLRSSPAVGGIFSFHNPLAGRGIFAGTPATHQPNIIPVLRTGGVSDDALAKAPERGNTPHPRSTGSPKSLQFRQRENVSSFSGLGCSENVSSFSGLGGSNNISNSGERTSSKDNTKVATPSQLTPFFQGVRPPLTGQGHSGHDERKGRLAITESSTRPFGTKQKILSGKAGPGRVDDWEGHSPGGKEGHPHSQVRESSRSNQREPPRQSHRACECCTCPYGVETQRNCNYSHQRREEALREKKCRYGLARRLLKKICYVKQKEEMLHRAAIRFQQLRLRLEEQHSMLFYADSQHTDASLRPSSHYCENHHQQQQQQRRQQRNSHRAPHRARPCPDHCATSRPQAEGGDNPQPSTSKAPSTNGYRNVAFVSGDSQSQRENDEEEDEDGTEEEGDENDDDGSYSDSKDSYYDDSDPESRPASETKGKNKKEVTRESEDDDETPDDDSNDCSKAGFFR